MTSPEATPEQNPPAPVAPPAGPAARDLSNEELRAKVAALAEEVRQLGNGSYPMPEWRPARRAPRDHGAAASDPGAGSGVPGRSGVAAGDPGAGGPASPGLAEELAKHSSRLLATVIETAELAAAEIRAGAEREAADIRERAAAAVDEAKAALVRYREALGALQGETELIERSVSALREQTLALEADRANIDAAVELLRRLPRAN
jgi:hypothetical protein